MLDETIADQHINYPPPTSYLAWTVARAACTGQPHMPCTQGSGSQHTHRMVMHLMMAAGASAPADAVFRFTAGEAMQTEDDDEDADRSEDYSDDGRASDL